MAENSPATTEAATLQAPVVVKKYANRRLYNTETSSYITLENLADMIRAGRDFVVYDAKSSEDITRGVLTQIIVEEEGKGTSMLPTNFLRQLIGFYGDSLQGVVPRYLESAMSNFARQQQQMRQAMQTFSPFIPLAVPASVEEIGRQNMALMERAMAMFNPFSRQGDAPGATGPAHNPVPGTQDQPASTTHDEAKVEVDALRHEVESLRAQLAIARAEAVMVHVPPRPIPETHSPQPPQAANVMADPPVKPIEEPQPARKARNAKFRPQHT
jgi:polyhydroxyalkanoate synthesis repressor PhaR